MFKNKTISIIGLGYVGLPTALIVANAGYKVYGYDKDTEIIKNLMHPDFMLIRESGLIARDEQLEYLKKMFDGDTEWLDFRCCYEDEDTLVWKDLMYINSEDKKVLVTNYEAYKDNLVWRIMLNVKEVSKEMEKIP